MDLGRLVEIGLAALGGMLAAGLGVSLAGRVAGSAVRGRRRAARPPSPGTVPPDRHRNISNVATH